MDAFNSGDVERVLALYEADAVFSPEPGKTVQGREAIREACHAFFALRPTIDIRTLALFDRGDGTALVQGRWTIAGTGPDGAPGTKSGRD
jgi:uncharacterized protein (TIGR02246 family)